MKICAFIRVMMIIFTLLPFCLSMEQSSPFAQNEDPQKKEKKSSEPILHTEETVVVTASMTRKKIEDCPASVMVFSGKELSELNVSNVFNALSSFPGIFIQRTGDFGRADVEIRGWGSNGRRVAIMIDGRPEKMGLFGCIITHSFSLANIDRIEVVKGPASVLYGSDALGGVVNIFTKHPRKRYETNLSLSYGSYNSQHYLLEHGGQIKKFYYYITADRSLSEGHLPYSNFDAQDYSAKIGCSFSQNIEMEFQAKYFTGDKNEPGPVNASQLHFWNDYRRGSFDLTTAGTWQNSDMNIKIFRNYGHHIFSDGWNSRDTVQGGLIKYTGRKLANNELTLGADYAQFGGKLLSSPAGKWQKRNAGFFVTDEYTLFSKVILSGGFRVEEDSVYGSEWAAQAGIVFHAAETTCIRISISRGFRFPQINELYMFPISSPDLAPEHALNYEAGINHSFAPFLHGELTLFYAKGDNLIQTLKNPAPFPPFRLFNTGHFNYKGVEAGLRIALLANLKAQIYYSFLDPGTDTRGKAKHKFDFAVTYQKDNLDVSWNIQHVADYYGGANATDRLPNYTVINSRIKYGINRSVSIFAGINNIFDKLYCNYVDLPGLTAGPYLMPGRTFMLGLDIQL